MEATTLLNAFSRYHVKVQRYPGWETRNHGLLAPHVIMVHDSVTGHMNPEQAAMFCLRGRTDLAGPLYECLIGPDGLAHLIANGVTYNAGKGNGDRLWQARRAQKPLDMELPPPPTGDYNGNLWAHGIAMITYGAGPYTAEQLESCARVCAAYAFAEGWNGVDGFGSVIGHGEFSRRKVDPFADMGSIRRRVRAIMAGSSETWHTVVSGDTLWSLARRYGVTVVQIKQWNDLTSDMIGIGWRLRVK